MAQMVSFSGTPEITGVSLPQTLHLVTTGFWGSGGIKVFLTTSS